jgi:Tol biopolymer transport system component
VNHSLGKAIALVGALTIVGSGCAWMQRVTRPAANDPIGAAASMPALSADGRYVAYAAHTDTSAPGVLDGVYRWDTVSGTRTLVSVGIAGALADDASGEPAISADGRYVAFSSDASNLVPTDTNDSTDVFVRDLVAGTTQRVSVTSRGAEVGDYSYTPSISDDGRYVAFISDSDDLSSLDSNLSSDAYVYDRTNKTVKLASIAGGVQPDFGISEAVISGDGKHLAFTTDTDLLSGDQNMSDDVYEKNLGTGSVSWISRPKLTDPSGGGGDNPSLSFDGRFVAFVGGNDIDNKANPYPGSNVFVRDTSLGVVTRASTTPTGGFVNGSSLLPVLSSDGSRVVFVSTGNVSGTDTNGATRDAFVKTLATGKVTLVSTEMFLSQSNVDSTLPTITRDGRYAGFFSTAAFAGDDTNGVPDLYIREIDVPTVTSISPTSAARGSSVTLTITGSNMLPNASVIPLSGVYIPTATTNTSSTSITVTLAIDANAPTGTQSVFVKNPGTGPGADAAGVGRCDSCLTIK